MNVIKEIESINLREFQSGIFGGITKGSWHEKYKDSSWVYIGGMSYELTEGDILCVMSQWGEIEDINLVRDKDTGKSLGYAFVKYEDQRSTILAVDNFNGIKLLGRVLRCDHVDQYRLPKEVRQREEELLSADPEAMPDISAGHAYKTKELASSFTISAGIDVWAAPINPTDYVNELGTNIHKEVSTEFNESEDDMDMKNKKEKKEKKSKKESKEGRHHKEEKKEKHSKQKLERRNSPKVSRSRSRSRERASINDNQREGEKRRPDQPDNSSWSRDGKL